MRFSVEDLMTVLRRFYDHTQTEVMFIEEEPDGTRVGPYSALRSVVGPIFVADLADQIELHINLQQANSLKLNHEAIEPN